MTTVDIAAALADLPLLSGAGPGDLERVAALAGRSRYAAGDLVLRRGEPADRFHVISTGRVALSLHVAGRGDLTVETLGPGDVLGVSWAVPPHRWGFDARALVDLDTIVVDARPLREATQTDDPLGRVLLRGVNRLLGERLDAARLRLLDLYGGSGGP